VIPWTLVAIVALAVIGVMLRLLRVGGQGVEPVATFNLDLGDLSLVRGGSSQGNFVAMSPDGRRFVITARGASAGQSQQRLYQRVIDISKWKRRANAQFSSGGRPSG